MSERHLHRWGLLGSALWLLSYAQPIAAQVIPDNTLPVGERSQVTGNPTVQIDGGARRGGNLFHSFSQFSIPTGGSAFFNNAADVQNILTRVTGSSISNIDGLIRANGTANLFLINPNGIIFGPNASLNIGGSFTASTASSIKFADGTEFSAVNPSASPLLTVSVPIGLQFNGRQGDIVVQAAPENVFTEVGDTGQLLGTAQPVNSATDGTSFNAISGNLDNRNDVDLYKLYLTQGVPFRATTVNGSQVDTQLFLFDGRGLGLFSNDDAGDTSQSTVPLNQSFTPVASGTYYLGISSYSNGPRSSQGYIFGGSEESNGPGSGLPLSEWDGNAGSDSGTYMISLNPQEALLQVQAGKTLALVGGNVTVQRSNLQAPGGRVDLGGVAGSGMVGLNLDNNTIDLSFPNQLARADVSLSNSNVSVRGASGGIGIVARNIDITRSVLLGGIPRNLSLPNTQTRDLELNATGSITLRDSYLLARLAGQGTIGNVNLTAGDRVSLDRTLVLNNVESTGVGNAGNVNITTGSLSLTNGTQMLSLTRGRGNVGSVNINARDTIYFDGSDSRGFPSGIYNVVASRGIGNSGGINITTGSLSLTNGAQLASSVEGQGNGGNVNVNARDTVYFEDNNSAPGINTGLFNSITRNGIGTPGNVNITTRSLSFIGGARLVSRTTGRGNAGSVNINAQDRVLVDGEDPSGNALSSITTQVNPVGVGQGGDVTITTGSLVLTNGGSLNTSTQGQGNAGRVTIHARDSVQIRGTASISNGELGTGKFSGVFTSTTSESVGNGGDVTITTGSLSVSEQGRIITDARSQGNAGNIRIQASGAVSFDGGDAISTLSLGGAGRGGNIDIIGRSLSVLNNAQLSASTSGNGDAGNITVSADTVGVSSGGRLLTTTFSSGNAGNITVNTPDLQLSGATSGLFAQTTSTGNAGNLTIQPRDNGQNVRVNLQNGAQISASTPSSGRGGNLTISAPDSITLTGNGSVIAAGTGGSGAGGNLNLRTGTLNIQNRAEVTVSSAGTGSAGSLFVDADRIYLSNQGSIRADTTGGGGNIDLRSPFILLRNGSSITTNATGSNVPGGNVAINTRFLIAVLSEDSNISANSENFRGGNVSINAFAIYGIQPRPNATPLSDITATGATSALSGTIDVITAGIDPTSGLVALPTDLVDPSGLIAQGCPANRGNAFVISGRGGLPPTPEQQLDDDAEWQDRRRLVVAQKMDQGSRGRGDADFGVSAQPNSVQSNETRRRRDVSYSKNPDTSIIEATGVQVTSTGEIFLVATTPDPTIQNRLNQAIACQGR